MYSEWNSMSKHTIFFKIMSNQEKSVFDQLEYAQH